MLVTFLAQTLSFPCDPKATSQNDLFNEITMKHVKWRYCKNKYWISPQATHQIGTPPHPANNRLADQKSYIPSSGRANIPSHNHNALNWCKKAHVVQKVGELLCKPWLRCAYSILSPYGVKQFMQKICNRFHIIKSKNNIFNHKRWILIWFYLQYKNKYKNDYIIIRKIDQQKWGWLKSFVKKATLCFFHQRPKKV